MWRKMYTTCYGIAKLLNLFGLLLVILWMKWSASIIHVYISVSKFFCFLVCICICNTCNIVSYHGTMDKKAPKKKFKHFWNILFKNMPLHSHNLIIFEYVLSSGFQINLRCYVIRTHFYETNFFFVWFPSARILHDGFQLWIFNEYFS